ncbi:hypothetical protein PQX77_007479 [Marasmius sp. AFHP31]|nr:hypothetical protein PQX77_007479 [Marasmius sp. AFHP31]
MTSQPSSPFEDHATVTNWELPDPAAAATESTNDRRVTSYQQHNEAHARNIVEPIMASGVTSSAVSSVVEVNRRAGRRNRRRDALPAQSPSSSQTSSRRTSSSTMSRLRGFQGTNTRKIKVSFILVPMGACNVEDPLPDYAAPKEIRVPELKRPTFVRRSRELKLERTVEFRTTDPPQVVYRVFTGAIDSINMEMVPSPDPSYAGQNWTVLKPGNRPRGVATRLFHPLEEARSPMWWTAENICKLSEKDSVGVDPATPEQQHDAYLFFGCRFGLGALNGHKCITMKLLNGTGDAAPGAEDIGDDVHLMSCPQPDATPPPLGTLQAATGSVNGSTTAVASNSSQLASPLASSGLLMPAHSLSTSAAASSNRRPRSDSLEVAGILQAPTAVRPRLDGSPNSLSNPGDEDHMDVVEEDPIPLTDPPTGPPTSPASPSEQLAPVNIRHPSHPLAGRVVLPLPRRIPRRGAVANLLIDPLENSLRNAPPLTVTPPPAAEVRSVRLNTPSTTGVMSPDLANRQSRRPPTPAPLSRIYFPTNFVELGDAMSDIFRRLPDRTFKFTAPDSVPLAKVASSLLNFLLYRVKGGSTGQLGNEVEIIGSSMAWEFILSQMHVEVHWGLAHGFGTTKTIVASMWKDAIFGEERSMWVGGTENFKTLCLTAPINPHTMYLAQAFGAATTFAMCHAEQLPQDLSPAFIQAVIGGYKSVIDLVFIRDFSPELANILVHQWPSGHAPPDLRIREDGSNRQMIETLVYMLEELDLEPQTLDGLLPEELNPLRERVITNRLLGASRGGTEFDENPLVKRFKKGMNVVMDSRSMDPPHFLDMMGRASKTLISSLTPTLIFKAEVVIRNIVWKSSSSRPEDLREDEQQFKAIFEAWIAQPGHPSHPNVLERVGHQTVQRLSTCGYYRARCFSNHVAASESLVEQYTASFFPQSTSDTI